MYSAMFSDGAVTERTAYEVSLEHAPMCAGLCASVFEEYVPLHSIVVSDYSNIDYNRSLNFEEMQGERTRIYL